MTLKQFTLAIVLMFTVSFVATAQDQDVTEATLIDDNIPAKVIEFNPNGVQLEMENNMLLLHFKNRVANAKCEIINKKGELLIVKRLKSTMLAKFDVSNFKKGKYFVRVSSEDIKDFLRFTKK